MDKTEIAKLAGKLRHVQVPNNMCIEHGLEPFDLLVYATIKRFMNQETKEAYPSIATIKSMIGCRSDKVRESIRKLNGKYFGVYYKGKKAVYVFSKQYKCFEPFSYEFLDRKDLTSTEKAYIISIQQFMFKDIKNYGKVSFSNTDLEKLINMPSWEIRRHDRALQEKGFLELIKTKNRDFTTGLPLMEKLFDMQSLGQQIIWKLCANAKRVRENNSRMKSLMKDVVVFRKLLKQKDIEIEALKQKIDNPVLEVLLKL